MFSKWVELPPVLPLKPVNPAARFNTLLARTRVERVAVCTDFNANILLCRENLISSTTTTGDRGLRSRWMNIRLHVQHASLSYPLLRTRHRYRPTAGGAVAATFRVPVYEVGVVLMNYSTRVKTRATFFPPRPPHLPQELSMSCEILKPRDMLLEYLPTAPCG